MTPFGKTVAVELRSAMVPLETASIVDYGYLDATIRALLNNALFYVVPTPCIDAARARAGDRARALADTIRTVGVKPQGISLEVDVARSEAVEAFQDLIEAIADAEPTVTARCLGIA